MTNITTCRFCQHYSPQGRSGGRCGKLQVLVSAEWQSCPLVEHPFADAWDETVAILGEILRLRDDRAIEQSVNSLDSINYARANSANL